MSPSKVTSGVTTPATGILSDTTSSSNWADDVEAGEVEKEREPQNAQILETEVVQTDPPKDVSVETVKAEERASDEVSGVSSPDLASSTKEDDSSSAPNASSSESTWDTKSQTSEPAWIAERKERQSLPQVDENVTRHEQRSTDLAALPTPPKAISLQEAAPPTVNPWQRRAEEAKAKAQASPRPSTSTSSVEVPAPKENQRPKADSRPRAGPATALSEPKQPVHVGETEVQNSSSVPEKPTIESNVSSAWQTVSLPTSGTPVLVTAKNAVGAKFNAAGTSRGPQVVKDAVAWPTPDSAPEKERKEIGEKESEDKVEEDSTPATKRKKPEWKPISVPHSVIWETTSMNEPKDRRSRTGPGSERGARVGNGVRGRGGNRGASNSTSSGTRQTVRTESVPKSQDIASSAGAVVVPTEGESEGTLAPTQTVRSSSTNARREHKPDPSHDRSVRTNGWDGRSPNERGTTAAADAGLVTSSRPTDGRRAKPSKTTHQESKLQSTEDAVPAPIPRRSSIGTQTEGTEAKTLEGTGHTKFNGNAEPPIRTVASESRKENRNSEGARDPTWSRPAKRGGRGRGFNGSREIVNGHAGQNAYGSNYSYEYPGGPAFGVPQSPSAYQGPRAHQFNYPSPRGGYAPRGAYHNHSVVVEHQYPSPYAAFAAPQPVYPSVHTGRQYNAYDMGGIPMSAMPFPAQMDPHYLVEMVVSQLEYYFSVDNLLKDMFLRKHMDGQGFVSLDVIANFNRVKSLAQDKDLVKMACMSSQIIEICADGEGQDRVRRADGWQQFVLPYEQRDGTAQNEGPAKLERPERPHLATNNFPQSPYRGPASAGVGGMRHRGDRRSVDPGYSTMNGISSQFAQHGGVSTATYGGMVNGEEMRGRTAKSPSFENFFSPTTEVTSGSDVNEFEPDAFPDERIGVLTVVVKPAQQAHHHSLASRTFSNGSIDSRSIFAESDKRSETSTPSKANGETSVNGSDSLPALSRHLSPHKARSGERLPATPDMSVFWVKDQETPVERLPSELSSEPYLQLKGKALDQRHQAATGTCPYDLDILYQFWCHFLIRNFNNRMYSDFKHYANEDGRSRDNITGLQNLLKFYSQALSGPKTIRDRVVKDYVELVKHEPAKLEGAAFKQLRSAWRNGALNLKNRKRLADIVDSDLKEQFDRLET